MTETTDSSAIDEKNQSNSSDNSDYLNKLGGFMKNVIIIFLVVIIYFTGSGFILYACKLAQSNILPTDENCAPYTSSKPNINEVKTNIFTSDDVSMKLSFPYNEENSKNYLIDLFREYKDEPKSNFLANYFISIIEKIINLNFLIFNAGLDKLNKFPEIFLVLLGPIILSIMTIFIFIANNVYLWFLWFAKMGWFFKTNTNESSSGKPKWEDVSITSPVSYGCAIGLVILFCILFFISLPLITFLSWLLMVSCIISGLSYKSVMNGKLISVLPIIKDTFKYYKSVMMSVLSFFVVISAFSKLGPVPGIFSIITLALIYFGIISIDLFKSSNKENLSPLVSDNQAKKTCSIQETTAPKKRGIFKIFLDGVFGKSQKGGNITKEIKSLAKNKSCN